MDKEKTSPLDKLTILGLGRKMDKIKKLANSALDYEFCSSTIALNYMYDDDRATPEEIDQRVKEESDYDEGYKAAMEEILNIVDPHRHKLKDKKKVLDLLDFKEHLNKLENGRT